MSVGANSTSDTRQGNSDAIRLTKITVEFSSWNEEERCPYDPCRVVFFVDGDNGPLLDLEAISPSKWAVQSSSDVNLPINVDNLMVVVQNSDGDDIGYTFLARLELFLVIKHSQSNSNKQWSKTLIVEDILDGTSLLISWEVHAPQYEGDTNRAQDPEGFKADLQRRFLDVFRETDQYRQLGKVAEIEDWTTFLRDGLEKHSTDKALSTFLAHNLSSGLMYHFKSTGNFKSIDEAIDLAKRNIDDGPDVTSKAAMMSQVGTLYRERFDKSAEKRDIDMAVSFVQDSANLMPRDAPGDLYIIGLYSLSRALAVRFDTNSDLDDIDRAITALTEVVYTVHAGHPVLPDWLEILVTQIQSRYNKTQDLVTLRQAIATQQWLIRITRPRDNVLFRHLALLLSLLAAQYRHTKDVEAITEMIEARRKLLPLLSSDFPDLAREFSESALWLYKRAQRLKAQADINEAITLAEKAFTLTAEDAPERPLRLGNLVDYHHSRYHILHQASDLDKAVAYAQQARDLTPKDGLAYLERQLELSKVLQQRFTMTGATHDIDEAVACMETVVELLPHDHSEHLHYQHDLAVLLEIRFERTAQLEDIENAIALERRCLFEVSHNDTAISRMLLTLGNSLTFRYKHTGDIADLHESITSLQKGLSVTENDDLQLVACYSNLGIAFQCRFYRLSDVQDLREAVSAHRKAVRLSPSNDRRLPAHLNNLATSMNALYMSTHDMKDLEEAIQFSRRSVELTSDDHPFITSRLSNLANLLQTRFVISRERAYIEEAVAVVKKAVGLTPPGHSNLASLLIVLGGNCRYLYNVTKNRSDIDMAIETLARARKVMPDVHYGVSACHSTLGEAYKLRHTATRDENDQLLAIQQYRLGTITLAGPPEDRLRSAIRWAEMSRRIDPEQSLQAFETAIELITLVAGLDQTLANRHRHLADFSGLSARAAAAALEFQRPDKALEWLENGRCLVWAQLNSLRTPVDALRLHDSELADEIVLVSKQLDNAGSRTNPQGLIMDDDIQGNISFQEQASDNVRLARRREELLKRARDIPGFEDFLRPASSSTILAHLPQSGPIVIVNVAESRCDAIALVSGASEPIYIPLPRFSFEKADLLHKILQATLSVGGLRVRDAQMLWDEVSDRGLRPKKVDMSEVKGGVMQAILEELWNDIAKPVLDGLRIFSPPSSTTRMWWCTAGPLSFLPVHAAGIYNRGSASIALSDYVVSSYAPTVSAITERAKTGITSSKEATGLCLISEPNAPGLARLPGTVQEVAAIETVVRCHGIRVQPLEGQTIQTCIDNIANHSCVHLACHAIQDRDDSLNSGFFLRDGRLSLSTIIKSDLKNAELAFLSACQTSQGDEKLSDEAVHLAAGMLAAGFRSVVATMWSITDVQAPEVSKVFYTDLLKRSATEGKEVAVIDGSHAAQALSTAVSRLRGQLNGSEASFFAWVPYVHYGL